MSQEPIVRRSDDVAAIPVERAEGATIRVLLGPGDDMPNFFLREFTLQPGARIPTHLPPDIEHEQLVTAGEMTLGMGDREWTVHTGDSVFIPAAVAHWYENRSTVPLVFICAVPRTEAYATEWIED